MRDRTDRRAGSDAAARRRVIAALVAVGIWVIPVTFSGADPGTTPLAPGRLVDTGLYADFAAGLIREDNLPYTPQYPLWSDGAVKRRWIHLPPGTSVDAADPAHWRFPVGTKLWKEFTFERRVETRYMELTAGGEWIFATYLWTEDGRDAVLAPDRGVRGVAQIRPGVRHDVPGHYDCLACHEGQPNRVLGFSALQLSPDRDPLAPHAEAPGPGSIDLAWLRERGLISGLPAGFFDHPLRIDASAPVERAALGYLHANCGGCHNDRGPLAQLGFSLEAPVTTEGRVEPRALATAVGQPSRYCPPGWSRDSLRRVVAGDPATSVILERMASRDPSVQMPPLGTHLIDEQAVALISSWIRDGLHDRAVDLSHLEHKKEEAR